MNSEVVLGESYESMLEEMIQNLLKNSEALFHVMVGTQRHLQHAVLKNVTST